MTIEEAQEECKKRFPIGYTYQPTVGLKIYTLKEDYNTYNIPGNTHVIQAHVLGGLLYDGRSGNPIFAKLISYPKGYIEPNQLNQLDDLKPLIKLLKEII